MVRTKDSHKNITMTDMFDKAAKIDLLPGRMKGIWTWSPMCHWHLLLRLQPVALKILANYHSIIIIQHHYNFSLRMKQTKNNIRDNNNNNINNNDASSCPLFWNHIQPRFGLFHIASFFWFDNSGQSNFHKWFNSLPFRVLLLFLVYCSIDGPLMIFMRTDGQPIFIATRNEK